MKRLLIPILCLAACAANAQNVQRWSATTGDVALVAAGTTATVQALAPTAGAQTVYLEAAIVYCSVACTVTQAVNGAAATATAGTVTPILPTPLNYAAPFTFWTASNVGAGTAQGQATHVAAGGTVVLCFNPACGNAGQVQIGQGAGTAGNYSVTISSITGTANITFYATTKI